MALPTSANNGSSMVLPVFCILNLMRLLSQSISENFKLIMSEARNPNLDANKIIA